jgi:putative membrane protein
LANASIAVGVVVLAALWLGPLVPLSRTAFSIHMLLHLGIMVIAAPLIAFGLASRRSPIAGFGNALCWGLFAALFEMVVVWGWHIPLLHNAADLYSGFFFLEQVSFFLASLAVWTMFFAARSRETAPAAALVLFFTFAHMTMFGMVLTLAPTLLYDPNLCRGPFGLDPLEDQQLGGVLMTVGGSLPYLIGTILALSKYIL